MARVKRGVIAHRRHKKILGKAKAEVYQGRYDNFRHNLKLKQTYIDGSSAAEAATTLRA